MYTEPKLWQMIFFPTLQLMLGFAVAKRYGWNWDTAIVLGVMGTLSIFTAAFILSRGYEEVLRLRDDTQPRQIVDLNAPAYNQDVQSVSFDTERMFAKGIMEQWHTGADIKFTETYWLKSGKWESIGGSKTRKPFIDMLSRWERDGLIERVNPTAENSTYRIKSKQLIVERTRPKL